MLKTGPIFLLFFPSFIVFLGIFRNTNSATVCQNSVFAKFGGCQKWGFRKENCIFCFFLFYVGDLETEKRKKKKMEKAKKPYKNRVFKVVMQKCEKSKKWIFCKNWLTLFVSGREKKRAFSCTLSVLAKKFFGPKQCKPGKTIKIVVSAEIAQKQKWHLFLEKGVFWHGWKSGFY